MGFQFGVLDELKPSTVLEAFVGVIFFIIFMDYALGLTEFMMSENPLYGTMFRIIYKELMMMGIVSFIIVMYEALVPLTHELETNIVAVDVSHILLFYVTIFFVVHAFYLIRISMAFAHKYRTTASLSMNDLIAQTQESTVSRWGKFVFFHRFLPFSEARKNVEFKIVQTLFESHYYLPEDFNFASYASGCFARYALEIINRSLFTWIVLLIMLILNFARMKSGLTCLTEEDILAAEGITTTTHRQLTEKLFTVHECQVHSIRYFLAGGFALCLYFCCLLLVSRIYRLRLLSHAGVRTPDDYVDFLIYAEKAEEEEMRHGGLSYRYDLMDAHELVHRAVEAAEEEEDEEGFRATAEQIRKTSARMHEAYAQFWLSVRAKWATFTGRRNVPRMEIRASSGDVEAMDLIRILERGNAVGRPGGGGGSINSSYAAVPQKAEKKAAAPPATPTTPEGEDSPIVDLGGKGNNKTSGKSQQQGTGSRRGSILKQLDAELDEEELQQEAEEEHSALETLERLLSVRHAVVEALDPEALAKDGGGPSRAGSLAHMAVGDENRFHLNRTHTMNTSFQGQHKGGGGGGAGAGTTGHHSSSSHPHLPPSNSTTPATPAAGTSSSSKGAASTSFQFLAASLGSGKNNGSYGNGSAASNATAKEKEPPKKMSAKLPAHSPRSVVKRDKSGSSANNAKMGSKMERQRSLEREESHMEAENNRLKLSNYFLLGFFRYKKEHGSSILGELVFKESWYHYWNDFLLGPSLERDPDHSHSKGQGLSEVEEAAMTAFGCVDLNKVYFFKSPTLVFRFIELGIMFNCLYMALWVVNMISVTTKLNMAYPWTILTQLGMVLPFIFCFVIMTFVVENCSLIDAVVDLNAHVVLKVLNDAIEAEGVSIEMRTKLTRRLFSHGNLTERQKMRLLDAVFDEVDADGSGFIDFDEFQRLIRRMRIKTTAHRMKLLFRSIDRRTPYGVISRAELAEFVFPSSHQSELVRAEHEVHRAQSDFARAQADLAKAEKAIAEAEEHYRSAEREVMGEIEAGGEGRGGAGGTIEQLEEVREELDELEREVKFAELRLPRSPSPSIVPFQENPSRAAAATATPAITAQSRVDLQAIFQKTLSRLHEDSSSDEEEEEEEGDGQGAKKKEGIVDEDEKEEEKA